MEKSKTTKTLRKLTLATTTAAMALGMLSSMESYAQTGGSGGTEKPQLTRCVTSGGEHVGYANDCVTGSVNCVDTTCK